MSRAPAGTPDPGVQVHDVAEVTVRFGARDGYELGGCLFGAASEAASDIALFACGGGISVAHYRHFLRGLAALGLPSFAFDYRGIGGSRPPSSLRRLHARVEDWSEYDCGGALDWLRSRFPQARIVGITHSFGAVLLTSTPGVERLSAIGMIAPHTGYWRDYHRAYRLPMLLAWHVLMPAFARMLGYFPAGALGLGDDLPRGVALQWAGRRTAEFQPSGTDEEVDRATRLLAIRPTLTVPLLAVCIRDDAFATPAAVARLLAAMPQATATTWDLDSRDTVRQAIGHFGFFRRRLGETVWRRFLAQLLQLSAGPTGRLATEH